MVFIEEKEMLKINPNNNKLLISGSESPGAFERMPSLTTENQSAKSRYEGERYRQMAKMLIGNNEDKQLSNEISAPYEVPQYPIEQIETKLIR